MVYGNSNIQEVHPQRFGFFVAYGIHFSKFYFSLDTSIFPKSLDSWNVHQHKRPKIFQDVSSSIWHASVLPRHADCLILPAHQEQSFAVSSQIT